MNGPGFPGPLLFGGMFCCRVVSDGVFADERDLALVFVSPAFFDHTTEIGLAVIIV